MAVVPPGGSVDQVARILQVPLQAAFGQGVIVENKGGACSLIGAAAVAAAPEVGYTFAAVFDTLGVNPALIPSLPFDSRKNLLPIVLVGISPMVLATISCSEHKTFADVVLAAKTKKNVSYVSIGSGRLGDVAITLLGKEGGIDWAHIPYKGGGALMNDAVEDHVPLSIGLVFVTKRMNKALNSVLKNSEIAGKLDVQGIGVLGGSADAARAFIDNWTFGPKLSRTTTSRRVKVPCGRPLCVASCSLPRRLLRSLLKSGAAESGHSMADRQSTQRC